MNFFLWVESLVLSAAAVLAGLGAAWLTPQIVLQNTTLSETAVRAVLAFLAAAFLGGAGVCLALWWPRRGLSQLLRLASPKGQIFITPYTVSQLAISLLKAELPETPFRVYIRPSKDALFLRVVLRLPAEIPLPSLAERLQDLLTSELSRRTGLTVQEVQVVVHGTTPATS